MLRLAKDGIFPVTRDADGKLLPYSPASGFDFPGTIQGEGKLNGIPSLFIRVAGCNLRCCWQNANGSISPCDTPYASYALKESYFCSLDEICRIVRHNTENAIDHLVLTGGEPFLQAEELTELCIKLQNIKKYHITIETNATLYNESLAGQIDLFSLSPKLSSSGFSSSHARPKPSPDLIQAFIAHARTRGKDFQLKFVYACEPDIEEIKNLLSCLEGWKNEDILLMPLGSTPRELRENTRHALRHCLANGWRYCDRLHISLFGIREGV